MNKVIIGHLNINSLRIKFELPAQQIEDNIGILMISETKLDENIPATTFFTNGFSSFHCLDRNCNGGSILLYIWEDVPSNLFSIEENLAEAFFTEINLLNKKKLFLSCSYSPKRASIANHITALSKSTDIYKPLSMTNLYFNAGVEDTDKNNLGATTLLVW